MPNLPYQSSGWNSHSKVSREINFPLVTDLSVLDVTFTYEGPLATYIQEQLGAIEPEYSLAGTTLYLRAQSGLQPIGGGAVRYTRSWCSLPAQQTNYGSRLIDRPVMHDIVASGSYAVSFDNGVTSHVFTARKSVSAVGSVSGGTAVAVAAESFGTLPASTFTMSDGTNTSNNNLNTAPSSLQSAIESNLSVLTSVEVSGTPDAVTISWTGTVVYVSTSATGVTMEGGAGTDGSVTFRSSKPTVTDTQSAADPTRTLTSTAHGGAVGDLLAVWNGDKLVGTTKVLAVATDTVTIPAVDEFAPASLAVTHLQFADTSSTRYVNGPAACTVKEVTDFYLPGVSTGITTPADIPLVAPKLDPVSWLTAIQAATAYVVCEGSQLERWLGGPIYAQTTISVQMSDALDTVAVGA